MNRALLPPSLFLSCLMAMSLSFGGTARAAETADPALDAAIDDAWSFAHTRLASEISYIKTKYPTTWGSEFPRDTYTSGSNIYKWDCRAYTDWTSGFFIGSLWLTYEETGDAAMMQGAKDWSVKLKTLTSDSADYDHDLGLRFQSSFYNAYQFSNAANDPGGAYKAQAKQTVLDAATALDTRYNMGGVPANALKCENGDPQPYGTFIDSTMNDPLYFIAWDLSGRPTSGVAKTWYDHGVAYANTLMAQHVRADGSSYHLVTHNDGSVPGYPANGQVYQKFTGQGFANESTWSRGQAWGIYGFAQIYSYTKDDPTVDPIRYLNTSKEMADYFISHLPNYYAADPYNYRPGDFVPPSDFDAALGEPVGPWNGTSQTNFTPGQQRAGTHAFVERDSSAAAIAASGLFELSDLLTDPTEKNYYFGVGEDILRCLLTYKSDGVHLNYLAKDSLHQGILADASQAWNTPTDSMSYGDYYLLDAMTRYEAMTVTFPGDANRDGKVSFADYLVLESNFGKSGATWAMGDFNNDGKVSFADYLSLEANFGKSIPEPATLLLSGMGALAIASRRGKTRRRETREHGDLRV